MTTVQFYNYLAAVEVEPQPVATPTHKFTRARYTLIGAAPLPGQAIDCPGQILQIRDCPGDSGTVGAYAVLKYETGSTGMQQLSVITLAR